MRNSLYPNLLDLASKNYSKGIDTTEIFEIGHIFEGIKERDQKPKSAILISGYENKKTWHNKRRNFDFFDIKSKILNLFSALEIDGFNISRSINEWYHPGVSADLTKENQIIASFGEIHPSLTKSFNIKQPTFLGEVHVDIIAKIINPNKEKSPITLSSFLPLKKDFAFLLPSDKSVQNLLDVIKNTDELVGQVNVFDLYSEEHVNKDVSVGVEVEIIQKNKVFNSEEISYIMDKIIKNVEKKLDAKLRKS